MEQKYFDEIKARCDECRPIRKIDVKALLAEVERLSAELAAICQCKDCKWYADEPYQGGGVCVNADSDWCADYPPADCSCKHCERVEQMEGCKC